MDRLTYDTFPRSGTAFLHQCLAHSFDLPIVWGGHRITTFRKEPNVITSIRNPKDSVASWIEFRQLNLDSVDGLLDWYIRFANGTLETLDRIYVVKFEDLISNPMDVMEKYATRFLLPSPRYIHKDLIVQAVNKTHSTNLPREINNIRSAANEAVASNNLLLQATEIYQQVIKFKTI
jgi:hypothetical protein